LLVVHLPLGSSDNYLDDKLFEEALNLVDSESQAKVKRFYRREDAWRGLAAQLLLLYAMKERGIPLSSAIVRKNQAGKPYLDGYASFAFNKSHDNSAVILACEDKDTEEVGVDVMKLELPRNETISSFIEVLSEQLSANERLYLTRRDSGTSEADKLSDTFLLWTLKEAYSKALGLGLSFDFSQLDYDFKTKTLKVNGDTPSGWEIRIFDLHLPPENPGEGTEKVTYRCSLAKKLRGTDGFSLLNDPPPIRYLDVMTLVAELTGS